MNVDDHLQATKRGNPAAMNRRASLAMTVLVAFLCLPELALLGFFATGALFSAPAGEPRNVDAVVVLGGDAVTGGRYARGRDLVLAGYSQRLILMYPSAAEIKDAQSRLPGVEIVDSTPAQGSWGEAMAVRELHAGRGLALGGGSQRPAPHAAPALHLGLRSSGAPVWITRWSPPAHLGGPAGAGGATRRLQASWATRC
jgi:hypothetical protein